MEQVRTRFGRVAAEWDANPMRVALARTVTEEIRKAVVLHTAMNAMDFGAGTGLVTLGLLPYVGYLTAVDTSGAMLRVLEEKLKAMQLHNVHTLLSEVGSPLPVSGFDLIVSSMVLHHISDVTLALQRLRPCLRPGGWIALADLDVEDGTFHADATGVYHHGFDRKASAGGCRRPGLKTPQLARPIGRYGPCPTVQLSNTPYFSWSAEPFDRGRFFLRGDNLCLRSVRG
jgi:ubiquinone/menaquinone biosynthesis C-methylase UbiE